MRAAHRILLAVAALAAATWWIAARLGWEGLPWLAAKTAAVAALAAMAVVASGRRPRTGTLLVAGALLAHAAGDLLIETAPLAAAMAVSAAGDLAWAVALRRERRRWEEVGGGAKLAIGLCALGGAGLLARAGADLPTPLGLAVPVFVLARLSLMTLAQVARRGQPWVAGGAVALVAADALVALSLLAGGAPLGRLSAWPLHWVGELAIALGWLYGARPAAAPPAAVESG